MNMRHSFLGYPYDEREEDRKTAYPIVRSHCVTRMETIHFRHKWVIAQFSVQQELCQPAECIVSSKFGDERYEFWLKLFPTGKDEECAGFLSLFLQILRCPDPKLQFRVNFTLETMDGPRGCALNKSIVAINRGGIVTASKFFAIESLRHRAERFMPDDVLTVGADLTVYGESQAVVEEINELYFNDNADVKPSTSSLHANAGDKAAPHKPIEDLEAFTKLYKTGDYSDFVIQCGDKEFKVHKCILASRSKFFEGLLQPGNKEFDEGKLVLPDMDPEVVEQVICYMYTLDCKMEGDMPTELLYAADRLLVDGLKTRCTSVITRNITVQNVCPRLVLADDLNADKLFRRLVHFFADNRAEILATSDWEELKARKPTLAARIMEEAWEVAERFNYTYPSKRRRIAQ